MKKQAIIYGGAFNPPTIAHQRILQTCISYAARIGAEIWVLPSGNRSDKTITTSVRKRLELVEAFIASVTNNSVTVKIEQHELTSFTQTQTHQTHKHLQNAYPDTQQIWVFGSDSITTMHEWECGKQIYNDIDMLIINRPGYDLKVLPPRATILDYPPFEIDISSTLVRDRLRKKLDVAHLVPSPVLKVLQL